MDGILIIDKPAGMTSHDVVNRVRRILGTKRIGHTGTLDPFATGVLVLLIGKATRLAQFADKDKKEYVADAKFGFATDSGDLTGKPLGHDQHPEIFVEEMESVLPQFRGRIKQIPPMYSAKKVAGKKLYELARKGEVIERAPFEANIYDLEILETDLDRDKDTFSFRVVCSAGTYIRTLAEDIGKALNTGAHLTSLRRLAAGAFRIEDAVSLHNLEKFADAAQFLLRIERIISHLPRIDLSSAHALATLNGKSTCVDRDDLCDKSSVSMFDPEGKLIAVGVYDAFESCIKPKIVLG